MLRNSPTRSFCFFGLVGAGIVLAIVALPSVAASQTSIVKTHASRAVSTKGKTLFESSCAVCHGLDGGGGGEHAPNIGRASGAKSLTDSDLGRILYDGIPGKGMPAFNVLGDLKIRSILSYLRLLQAKTEAQTDTGNPKQGKEVFFGKGQCADCHAMSGSGHFLSRDLSDYAYDHKADDVRAVIVNPQEQEAAPHILASVATNAGQRFSGLIRNENTSSLQLQDAEGQFYLFMKANLRSTERSPAPSMPTDYKQKLSSTEIEDLVSYIVHESSIPKVADSQPSARKKDGRN